MQTELINMGLAFIEGFALIISPCILPILPVILAGSLTGNKSRPLGIVTGFIITFALFTLFSRALIVYTTINTNTLRNVSFSILLLLGIIMMSNTLTEKFNYWTRGLANTGNSLQAVNNSQGGFGGGMALGGLLGIIWTPCAGPVLAAVIVQVVLQKTTLNSMLVVLSFAIGAGIPMLMIAMLGQGMMSSLNFFRARTKCFRQLLGFILITTVLYFLFFQWIAVSFNKKGEMVLSRSSTLINGIETPYDAPQIDGITAWINSPALNLQELKGKVVLIDFWTYSCINCIRTLSYLKDWYAKYHAKGFEIIGIHSPEFQFEQDVNNVTEAVKRFEISYPVALDNKFVTWRNFQNEYWPAHYLINKDGKVVYVHFGEGEYDVTENNIRFLLGVNPDTIKNTEENYSINLTPETYLGYRRAERFGNTQGMVKNALSVYVYPLQLAPDNWALHGSWLISAEKIVSVSPDAAIKLNFRAGKVYMVMGFTKNPVTVKVLLNGKPIQDDKGSDVQNGEVMVNKNRLYSLVNLSKSDEGELEVIANNPGLEVYTFTFGN